MKKKTRFEDGNKSIEVTLSEFMESEEIKQILEGSPELYRQGFLDAIEIISRALSMNAGVDG